MKSWWGFGSSQKYVFFCLSNLKKHSAKRREKPVTMISISFHQN
jgi:hypothetical protein